MIQTSCEELGQGRQQGVPLLLASQRRFVLEEAGLPLNWLPAVLLEELLDVLPSGLLIDVAGKMSGQAGNGHWLVVHDHRALALGY